MAWITLSDFHRYRRTRETRGLGQGTSSECGPAPELQPGEQKACCPDIGWVVYSGEESYGICERAAAEIAAEGAVSYEEDEEETSPATTTTALSPLERTQARWAEIEERKRQLEERQAEIEEKKHQEVVQSLVASIQAQQAAAKLKEQMATELPEARIEIQETPGALPLAVGTAGYVGYMLGGALGAGAGGLAALLLLTR